MQEKMLELAGLSQYRFMFSKKVLSKHSLILKKNT